MGSGPDPVQKTHTEMSPEQKALFDTVFPTIQKFAGAVPQRYQGSTVADFTAPQTSGQDMALGTVPGINKLATDASTANSFYTNGNIWDPKSNPNLQGAIDAAVRPVYTNLTERALPAIRSGSIQSGNFGGSRQGIAEGAAIRDAGVTAGDISSKIAQGEYNTNLEAQQKAIGMTPMLQGAQTTGAQVSSGVGDIRQAMDQAKINAGVNAFNFDQNAPFMNAKDILSIMQGIPGATTVSTSNTPQPNPWIQALGLGGAALPLAAKAFMA